MHPYRPLYVVTDTREPPSQELRGLAVLLLVLGVLRMLPALVRSEGANTETAIAVLMLCAGSVLLVRTAATRSA